ncbi:MAG TPA: DUF5060 domain-containing protein [Tepidisphaeraceae bacterium]
MASTAAAEVGQWDIFEISLKGPPASGDVNPFVDVELSATFSGSESSFDVPGFYDGEGTYRIRFMPPQQGNWKYQTRSNRKELDGKTGSFTCTKPGSGNHGPVQVHNTFHFRYADGTPYKQIGTTCYAWIHQRDDLQEQTLGALKASPFNKLRMCVFPKNYAYNKNDAPRYPFEGTAPNKWDFTRFNPAFFQQLEKRVAQLREMNIEADLILFHPYDEGRWGFDRMDEKSDDRYLKYVVARLSAYRNVWWSMANEFDFMKTKDLSDWDRYFHIVKGADPYDHLRSIHNGRLLYDHNKPWVTHASIQNGSAVEDFGRASLYRDVYCKPIVFDEVKYEGNIPQRWGDLSAEEMVHRFWQGTIAGTYVGHGETYKHPEDIIWWARGGKLHGRSPARIAFLREVLEDSPADGIDPIDKWQDSHTAGKEGEYYLVYFGKQRPEEWLFELPRAGLSAGMSFSAEVIDTWDMTITPVHGVFKIVNDSSYRYHSEGRKEIKLPGKPYMAIRIRRAAGDQVKYKEGERLYGES